MMERIKESRSCWFYSIELLQWFNCWLETRPQRYNRDSSQVLCITIFWSGQSHSKHLSFQNFSSIGSWIKPGIHPIIGICIIKKKDNFFIKENLFFFLPAKGWSLEKWKKSSAEQPNKTLAALSKHMTLSTLVSVAMETYPENRNHKQTLATLYSIMKIWQTKWWGSRNLQGYERGAWRRRRRRRRRLCCGRICKGYHWEYQEEFSRIVSKLCKRDCWRSPCLSLYTLLLLPSHTPPLFRFLKDSYFLPSFCLSFCLPFSLVWLCRSLKRQKEGNFHFIPSIYLWILSSLFNYFLKI